MIAIKIMVETGDHQELEDRTNRFLTEMNDRIKKVIDIKFNDTAETRFSSGSYSAMVIYEI